VESIGVLEDRYGRHRQPKKRTQGDGGYRRKLAAARTRMTRRAVPSRRNGPGHKRPTSRRDDEGPGMQQQHKEPEAETAATPGKQENAQKEKCQRGKLATGTSMRIRKMPVKASWRSLSPLKRKKRLLVLAVRARDVEASTTLGTFARDDRKRTLDRG
jgi:hypothetical protein